MATKQYGYLTTGAKKEAQWSDRDAAFDGPASSEASRPAANETQAANNILQNIAAAVVHRAAHDGATGSYRPPRHTTDGNWDTA